MMGAASPSGARTGLPLHLQAEAELDRSGFRLAFPPELEARYRSDLAGERARELRIITRLGVILYLGCAVVMKIVGVNHASWSQAGIQVAGALIAVMLISRLFFRAQVADAVREGALVACCLICALAAILVVYVSPSVPTTQDFVIAVLPANFVLIFVRLRFPAAVAFVVTAFVAFAASVLLRTDISAQNAVFPICLMAILCLPALIGVHAYERVSRRIYLHALLQILRNEHLSAENSTLSVLSFTDPLTRVANRRRLDRDLQAFCAAHVPGGALLLIDIDRFKLLNDQHGHVVGDSCLRHVAQCLAGHLRRCDLLARFGGEEFAVLLPDLGSAEAVQAAERLRHAVQTHPFASPAGPIHVTVSIGLAVRTPGQGPAALVDTADKALYAAKQAGRNQVRVALASKLLERAQR